MSNDGKGLFGSSGSEASSWSLASTSCGRGAVDTPAANLSRLQELEWESDEPNARQGEEPGSLPPAGDDTEWVPREGVRPWISSARPASLQGQVLLVNLARSRRVRGAEGGGLSPMGRGGKDTGLSAFVNVVRITVTSTVEGRSLLEYDTYERDVMRYRCIHRNMVPGMALRARGHSTGNHGLAAI